MSGGGRAWRADGAAASLRHIGREKRAIYRLQTAPRHVSGCGGQCAAECAATGAARRRRGERVALSVVCGRGLKIASITLCRHEMILTGWGIDLPASASVSPASRFGGICPLFSTQHQRCVVHNLTQVIRDAVMLKSEQWHDDIHYNVLNSICDEFTQSH
jgi:hypothetical protein